MRRAASAALVALALATVTAACGSAKASPGMPHVDLTPKIELDLHGCPGPSGTTATSAACTDALHVVAADDPSGSSVHAVKTGTVLLVTNDSSSSRRVVGTVKGVPAFDTGVMHPTDTTTIKLDTPGTTTISDTTGTGHTTLVVTAPPGQSG